MPDESVISLFEQSKAAFRNNAIVVGFMALFIFNAISAVQSHGGTIMTPSFACTGAMFPDGMPTIIEVGLNLIPIILLTYTSFVLYSDGRLKVL